MTLLRLIASGVATVCSVLRFDVFRICVIALANGKAFLAAVAKRSPL
jgi:hypothetical protein